MAKYQVVRLDPNPAGIVGLRNSKQIRDHLDSLAFLITSHAIPHSGFATGRLVSSMGHRIDREQGGLVAILGSGAAADVRAVSYAGDNWSGVHDPSVPPEQQLDPPIRNNPKPVPTTPYKKAMDALGIRYRQNTTLEA